MKKVLIVDDEPGLRSFLEECLESDYEVKTAGTVDEALELLSSYTPELIFCDLKMPKRDGLDLLIHLNQREKLPAFVLMTAYATVDVAVRAMRLGAADFLQKPIESPRSIRELAKRLSAKQEVRIEGAKDSSSAVRSQKIENSLELRLSYGDKRTVELEQLLLRVASTDASVLLLGESGAGKEVVAKWLHQHSARAKGPLITVNCAASSDSLFLSELFGHEKGAFTGAVQRRLGKFEEADGGTLFFDELGELKLDQQVLLLRALQERKIERLGSGQSRAVDIRVVAATNRPLDEMVKAGEFREDLYYRLANFPVLIPSLRERLADIEELSAYLLSTLCDELGIAQTHLTKSAIAWLKEREWPGNIRQLRHVLQRTLILSTADSLKDGLKAEYLDEFGHYALLKLESPKSKAQVEDLSEKTRANDLSLEHAEKLAIEQALLQSEGKRKRAAEILGIGERTLYEKLKRYGIK